MPLKITLFFRKPREGNYSIENLFAAIQNRLPNSIEAKAWVCPFFSLGIVNRVRSILAARKVQGSINHITGDVHFLALALDRNRTILTIHDAAVLARLSGISKRVYAFLWFQWPMRRVAVITVISQSTREYLSKVFNIPSEHFRVIPDCINEEFLACPKAFSADCPRLLQIGTKRNKNIERVAAALVGLNCELRIIGNVSASQRAALEQAGVVYSTVSNLSLQNLVNEYCACDMLIFASTVEGFGMPIIEAQTVGRPVVTSDCSSMPEVAGEGACLVDPLDVKSIREGITTVIANPKYREDLIESGFKNARKYGAQSIAAQYASLYHELSEKIKL